jgi:hypothetical protein
MAENESAQPETAAQTPSEEEIIIKKPLRKTASLPRFGK